MAKIELSPAGMGIEIEARDIHVGVHGLVSSFISPHGGRPRKVA